MDRRTFVLLSGAASGSLIVPPFRLSARPPGGKLIRAQGRLAFEFDDQHRWSLWYRGEGPSVPLIAPTAAGIRLGGRLVALADLDDASVHAGTPPSGEATVLRGRTAGAFVEAEFRTAATADIPQAAITLRIYPETAQPVVSGVRYGLIPAAQILAGAGDLLAVVNGPGSRSPSSIESAQIPADAGERVSYGTLGLTRRDGSASRGLALAFDAGEPGTAGVRMAFEGLEARSDWSPPRAVASAGDASTVRFSYDPTGDGLTALRALYDAVRPADHQRLATAIAPAGWCSGNELGAELTENAIIANLEFAATTFDPRFFRYVLIDDGYARSVGDWDTSDSFPHGHRWLTERIHSRGLLAGLWLAPFGASEASGIPAAHPDWILTGDSGPTVVETRSAWGGAVYALDGAHPEVQDHLQRIARRAVQDWGYDFLTLDFLDWAGAGTTHAGGATGAEAYRAGLAALRAGAGTDAFLSGCGASFQHTAGYVNGMRVGADVTARWDALAAAARAAALRSFYQRNVWISDPDALVVRSPLSLGEAQSWTAIVAAMGGVTMLSDDLTQLPPERIEILRRALPTAPVAGCPIDVIPGDAPPATWVSAGAPDWITVVHVNWNEVDAAISLPLSALDLSAGRYYVYDVWGNRPLPTIADALEATVPSHSTLTVALRPAGAEPRVVGTTRHVVQGAVDVRDERWDATTRTLHAVAVNLDGRPYAVTIGVPTGWEPGEFRGDRPGTVRRLDSEYVVLEWPAGEVRDITWQLAFLRPTPRRRARAKTP